jgi:hypothetical protein
MMIATDAGGMVIYDNNEEELIELDDEGGPVGDGISFDSPVWGAAITYAGPREWLGFQDGRLYAKTSIHTALALSMAPTPQGNLQRHAQPPYCMRRRCAVVPISDLYYTNLLPPGGKRREIEYGVYSLEDGVLKPLFGTIATSPKIVLYEVLLSGDPLHICDTGCPGGPPTDNWGALVDEHREGVDGNFSVKQRFYAAHGAHFGQVPFYWFDPSEGDWYGSYYQTVDIDSSLQYGSSVVQQTPLLGPGVACEEREVGQAGCWLEPESAD